MIVTPPDRQARSLYYYVLQLIHKMTAASNRVSEVPYTLTGGEDPGLVESKIRELIAAAKDIEIALTPLDEGGSSRYYSYLPPQHEANSLTPYHVTLDAATQAALAFTSRLSMPGRMVVPGLSAIKRADFSSFLGDATWPFCEPPNAEGFVKGHLDPAPHCTSCQSMLGLNVRGHVASDCPMFPLEQKSDNMRVHRTGWQLLSDPANIRSWKPAPFLEAVLRLGARLVPVADDEE
jgi:hypothetical protein